MELDQSIKDAIKAKLPAQVSEVLQERLKLCDELEVENANLKDLRESHKKTIFDLNGVISELQKSLEDGRVERERVEKLELREALIEIRETHMSSRLADSKELFGMVFNNHKIHKAIHENTVTPIAGPDGYVIPHSGQGDKTETRDMT